MQVVRSPENQQGCIFVDSKLLCEQCSGVSGDHYRGPSVGGSDKGPVAS